MKKVLFLCGSPRGKKSASLSTALYMSRFLDYDYEFVDIAKARLSSNPREAEASFLKIVEKMKNADAIIWTFGAWVLFVPVQMQYLFDKLFTQEGYDFTGKIAASVMTSARALDDYDFHQKNKMFDYPSTGGSSALMRILFRSKKVGDKLMAFKINQITKEREKRLGNFLKTGTLGKGQDITQNR